MIDIEGIPGSGKSAAVHVIKDFLAESGSSASYFDEDALDHPVNFKLHAFLKNEQFKLLPYRIYDKLDWESEKPVLLEQWQEFAKKAPMKSDVCVFNSGVFQNPINEMMMRFDFSFPVIWEFIFCIYRSIAAMNPVFIYIQCTDIKARIEEEGRNRNPGWLNSAIEYHTSQGYGKRNGRTGLDGYVDCLEARQSLEMKILKELPVDKLVLTDPLDDWEHACQRIRDFLRMNSTVLSNWR